MTRARDLARFANANAISVDTNLNVGIGSTTPDAKLDIVGIVSATSFFGDGADITGISSVSFATTSFGLSGTPNIIVGVLTATSAVVGSAVTINSSGINVVGVITATTLSVGNIVAAAATFTNLTVNGTQTIINTTSLEISDKNIGIGSTSSPSDALVDGAGITIYGTTNKTITWKDNSDSFTFSEGIDIKGAVETVSVGSTFNIDAGKVILECDAQNGTVFTHNLESGNVGIVSLRNFPVTKNSVTTFTILFTQLSSTPVGNGNTTAASGIGTNITLTPLGVAGFTTSARVATASTITLSTTASDIDIITLAIHYNGSGTGTPGNYRVFASNNSEYRFGSIQP